MTPPQAPPCHALLKAYHQWSGQTIETAKALAKKLSERGFTSKREETGMFWRGIGLLSAKKDL